MKTISKRVRTDTGITQKSDFYADYGITLLNEFI